MERFLPLILMVVLYVALLVIRTVFAVTRLTPLLWMLEEANDGSPAAASQLQITRMLRSCAPFFLCGGLILALVHIFVQPDLLRTLFFVPPLLLLFMLIVDTSFAITEKSLRFHRKPVILSAVAELIFGILYFLLFRHFFAAYLPGFLSFLR